MSSCRCGSGHCGPQAAARTAPVLVVALGNTLAGDDGVASRILERLRGLPLPDDVELVDGGSDLLRLEQELRGRRSIVLIDALLDDGPPGRLLGFEDLSGFDESHGAHALSPAHTIALLRALHPDVRVARVTLLGVTIDRVAAGPHLSAPLLARLDALTAAVFRAIRSSLEECAQGIASAATMRGVGGRLHGAGRVG